MGRGDPEACTGPSCSCCRPELLFAWLMGLPDPGEYSAGLQAVLMPALLPHSRHLIRPLSSAQSVFPFPPPLSSTLQSLYCPASLSLVLAAL